MNEGVLHRHADGTEHRHFRAGFTIGNQVIEDQDGSEDHKHGILGKPESMSPVVWRETDGVAHVDEAGGWCVACGATSLPAPTTSDQGRTMGDRAWDEERDPADAPVWLSADEAHAWAHGWNAAVRECVEQMDTALAVEEGTAQHDGHGGNNG